MPIPKEVILSQTYRERTALVTGHTGFKGSWLSLWLLELGAKVIGYSLPPPTQPSLFEALQLSKALDDRRGSIQDKARVAALLEETRPDIIFHLAAQPLVSEGYRNPQLTFETNVSGLIELLEAVRSSPKPPRAIVVVTTDKCYRNTETGRAFSEEDPLGGRDPYSASKAAAEIIAHAYAHSFLQEREVLLATARAGNVIGGGDWAADRVLADAVRALERGAPVDLRSPTSTRPWQHVLDPLHGYLLLGTRLLCTTSPQGTGEAWNFGPAKESDHSVKELVELFLSAYGQGLWRDAAASAAPQPHEANTLRLDSKKAQAELNWRPQWDFRTALTRTASWYKKYHAGVSAEELCLNDLTAFSQP